ncbi:SGNH hydrolase-type esterase domain-containing protein [Massariosphaeria phaeospora]|uniref:SGNH hydrolase-type esterase domain-containing protein n=1 Tax=Massariosphaeria phaeospora TaxID=100035 RepID=A0A7C8HYJ5_9PLEO|nr:SGNH hydrolase-type esterase domain-containing protein [Massariosphaeria phaeospora]
MKLHSQYAHWAILTIGLPSIYASPTVKRENGKYRYVGMGDSFAAGIGVGQVESTPGASDCSRYTGGYPNRIQEQINATDYQFIACSGAVGEDIIEKQIPQLHDKYDLITVSAGGNDVLFSGVLKACLYLPKPEADCIAALVAAEEKINNELTGNTNKLLNALGPYLSDQGIIVWTLYAEFFEVSPEPCNSQSWCLVEPRDGYCSHVTVGLRTEFNRLVAKASQIIKDVVQQWSGRKAYAADWNEHVMSSNGQLCEAGSGDRIDDESNRGLAFIRQNIGQHYYVPGEKREIEALEARDLLGLPDTIMQNFHPNEVGVLMQVTAVLEHVLPQKAKIDGTGNSHKGACKRRTSAAAPSSTQSPTESPSASPTPKEDKVDCLSPHKNEGGARHMYLSRNALVNQVDKFCAEIDGKSDNLQRTYDEDQYVGVIFYLETIDNAISKDECKEKLMKVVDCKYESNTANPMDWKYGGRIETEKYNLQVEASGDRTVNRYASDDHSPLQKPVAKCNWGYKVFYDDFTISGAGFLDGGWGKDMQKNIDSCAGGSLENWKFDYHNKPDGEGFEWKASGTTIIGKGHCFGNAVRSFANLPDFECD